MFMKFSIWIENFYWLIYENLEMKRIKMTGWKHIQLYIVQSDFKVMHQ